MAESGETSNVVPFVTRPLPYPQRPRPATSAEPLLNVLVIDDTPEDRMAVRFALEAGGFVLQEASNADKGLALAKASTPDCILLDYGLPDMEGLEVLEVLRQPDGRLPCAVVMFSGSGKADIATAALKAGALDYLVKDRFDADTLRRAIRSTVRQFKLLEAQRVGDRRNAQLAAIVSSSSDAIICVGTDNLVQTWNPGAQQLFGYTEAEAVGRSVVDLIIPVDKEAERLAIYDAVMSGKVAVLKETERRRKDGTMVPVELNASPILDAFGRVVALSLVFRDVSERRRAEAALRESEEKFRAVFNQQFQFMAVLSPEGRLLDMNDLPLRVTGVEREAVLGRLFWDTPWWKHSPSMREAWPGRLAAAAATDGPLLSEDVYTTADGSRRLADCAITAIRSKTGGLRFFVFQASDITERKLGEVALRTSEERFRTIVNTAQEGIWALDRHGRTIFANPRLAELLGTSTEDVVARPVADFLFPEDIDFSNERISANLAGQTEDFEIRFRRVDGSALHALGATAPLRGSDGEIIGALGGFVDLSDRKKAEERQRMLMREVAHRGKNLLAVVQSIAGRTLTGDKSLDEARTAYIGRLQALSRTYSSLTEEVFEGALLDEIVGSELQTFGGRARIDGPKVMVTAKVAQTFALIAHELATNAAKYGALSVPNGHLDVSWRLEGEGDARRFQFQWRESGGPPAQLPTRRGFGTQLISTVAGSELKCSPEIAYEAGGFSYRLDAPLSAIGMVIDDSPVRERLKSDAMRTLYDVWASQRGQEGQLPQFERFDRKRFEATGGLTVASISHNGDVRFIEVGRALTERLGRFIDERGVSNDDPNSLADAYRRCASGGVPCYEHLRFDFGDGHIVTFERLLVPFSRGGPRVTHIAGLVVYSGRTRDDAANDRA